jgi:ABC-type multidrug transport system fused ATPase/permease subunit
MTFKERTIYRLKLLYRGFGKYRWKIAVLIFLGFFGSLLEGVGINALIPLFTFVTRQGDSNDLISQAIKKAFLVFNISFDVKFLLIFISLLFIFKAILVLISNYISVKINSGYEEETRSNLFALTLKAGWPYLLKQKLGHLETILMTNVKSSSILLGYISSIVILASSLIVYAFVALNISFYVTLITLAFSSALFFVFKPIISRTRLIAYKEEGINREISHHVNENILGMKTVKAMLMEGRIAGIAKDYFNKLKGIRVRTYLLVSLGDALMEPASLIFICAIFAFFYYRNPNFNLAALGAIIYLVKQIFSYAQQLQKYILGVSASVPYLKNVLEYQEQAIKNKEENHGLFPFKFEDKIEFKNVNFQYDNEKVVLSDINF